MTGQKNLLKTIKIELCFTTEGGGDKHNYCDYARGSIGDHISDE